MEVAVAIDPVIVLAEELRSAEGILRDAAKEYARSSYPERAESIQRLLWLIKNLNQKLVETVPTSALGAAVLLRLVIERLPFSHARYADQFLEIARRLDCGQKNHADLVWLRGIEASLGGRDAGNWASQAVPLLRSAILGAARPVLVFRTAMSGINIRTKRAIATPSS
jgi:hypothetical protein